MTMKTHVQPFILNDKKKLNKAVGVRSIFQSGQNSHN